MIGSTSLEGDRAGCDSFGGSKLTPLHTAASRAVGRVVIARPRRVLSVRLDILCMEDFAWQRTETRKHSRVYTRVQTVRHIPETLKFAETLFDTTGRAQNGLRGHLFFF